MKKVTLSGLYLNNFKGFYNNANKPIKFGKRITLIFGKNSVGKSSVLEALKLQQQSIKEGVDLRINSSNIDIDGKNFGSFKKIISKGNTKNILEMGVSVRRTKNDNENKYIERGIKKEFKLSGKSIICSSVELFSPEDDTENKPFLKINNSFPKDPDNLLGDSVSAKIISIDNDVAWTELFNSFKKHQDKIEKLYEENIKKLKKIKDANKKKERETYLKNILDEDEVKFFHFHPSQFKKHKIFLKTNFKTLAEFIKSITEEIKQENYIYLNNTLYIGRGYFRKIVKIIPDEKTFKKYRSILKIKVNQYKLYTFICYAASYFEILSNKKIKDDRKKYFFEKIKFRSEGLFLSFNKINESNESREQIINPHDMFRLCKEEVDDFFNDLLIVSSKRDLPQFFELEDKKNFGSIGHDFRYLPLLIEKNKNKVNSWLKRFSYDFRVAIKKYDSKAEIVFKKSNFTVNLKDGGSGVESIMPIIAQVIGVTHKTLIFEEPERRLHPSLQIKLAEIFVENSIENQIIIETHSENLLLGLCKQIREKKIKNTDVQINYVYMDKEQSKIDHLVLDENGNFITPWRHGFFTERLTLL
jgi:predicted ATPase